MTGRTWQNKSKQGVVEDICVMCVPVGMLCISAHILDHFQKLKSLRKCHNGMDNNPVYEVFLYYQR